MENNELRKQLSEAIVDSIQITKEDCERFLMAMITEDRYYDLLGRIKIIGSFIKHPREHIINSMTGYLWQIIEFKIAEKLSPAYKKMVDEGIENFKSLLPHKLNVNAYRNIKDISNFFMNLHGELFDENVYTQKNVSRALAPIVNGLSTESLNKLTSWGEYDDPTQSTTYDNFMKEVIYSVPRFCISQHEKENRYKIMQGDFSSAQIMRDLSLSRYIMNESKTSKESRYVKFDFGKNNTEKASNSNMYDFALDFLNKELKRIFDNPSSTPEQKQDDAKKLLMKLSDDFVSDEEKIGDVIEIVGRTILDKKSQLKIITYLTNRYNRNINKILNYEEKSDICM